MVYPASRDETLEVTMSDSGKRGSMEQRVNINDGRKISALLSGWAVTVRVRR